MATVQASKKLIKAGLVRAQMTPAPIKDFRELKNGNIVLIFENAEVIMPGTWRLNNDLYVGDNAIAYWDSDGGFHLETGC